MSTPNDATLKRFDAALAHRDESWYELTLIVSGASALSARAIDNARRLCDTYLEGRYHLSVVDLREEPVSVANEHVLAAPTLVKNRPLPVRKFVGDLSNTDRVLLALGLSVPGASEALR
ncbi:MAG TPA: circadian clock KaiB family protein [Micromonosporaceae bacterium]|nr:circadian clock KaiB family protein [Micromonosporaceae bacterium]